MTDRLADHNEVVPDHDRRGETADSPPSPDDGRDDPLPAVVGGDTLAAAADTDVAHDIIESPSIGVTNGALEASRWARWRERRRHRVSHWDLPPSPKDWRYFVGGFGKILIVTGLLMFGFVAYQLWGTGIENARAQSKLRSEFDKQIAATTEADEPAIGIDSWIVRTDGDPATAGDDAPGDAAESGASVDADTGDTADGADGSDEPDGDTAAQAAGEQSASGVFGEPSTVVPGGIDLTDYAVEHDVPVIPGEAFARLEIPAIGTSDYVVPGVRLDDLKKGPGHYPDTPLPGQLGNSSIAGHRTTYGEPFMDLDDLDPGDEIIVTMITGDRFVYRVTGLQIVSPSDTWVISTRDPTVAELTLTTCDPKYTARDRLVVHSVLVPEKSSQVGVAEFYEFDVPDEPLPGDDPTFEAGGTDEPAVAALGESVAIPTLPSVDEPSIDDDTAGSASDEPTVEAVDQSAAEEPSADDAEDADNRTEADTGAAPADDDRPAPLGEGAELEAFEQGWFDDREAFPQIALWASVLILISIAGYLISKRFRRYSVGLLVTFAPFFVALYFFYQNVNRLLPPGL